MFSVWLLLTMKIIKAIKVIGRLWWILEIFSDGLNQKNIDVPGAIVLLIETSYLDHILPLL